MLLCELGLALLITLGMVRLAVKTDFVARPHRLVAAHARAVPLLGGAALCLAWLVIMAWEWWQGEPRPEAVGVWRIIAAVGIAVVGVWDDRKPMTPYQKLACQFAFAGAYLFAPHGLTLYGVFELFVLVFLMNAVNVLDIMDGLLLTSVMIGSAALLLVPGWLPAPVHTEVAALLIAAVALFCFNCPPARVFAGDAGSLLCGFLLTAWWLEAGQGHPLRLGAGLGVLAIPIFEVSLVIVARKSRRLTLLIATPDNFSLRLQDRLKWTRWQVLAATAAPGIWLGLAPWIAEHAPRPTFIVYGLTALATFAGLWWTVWSIPPLLAEERAALAARAEGT